MKCKHCGGSLQERVTEDWKDRDERHFAGRPSDETVQQRYDLNTVGRLSWEEYAQVTRTHTPGPSGRCPTCNMWKDNR